MKHCILIVLLCAVAGPCLAQTTLPAFTPASMPTSEPATPPDPAVVAECIKDIQDAKRPEQAGTAYARGCQANRKDPALHNAYMIRLIELKQWQLADYPAATLTTLQPENALAWSVTGYNAAKKGMFDRAIKGLARAAVLDPSDRAAAANLGQLIAWYELQQKPPVRLTDVVLGDMRKAKRVLASDEEFADSTGRVTKAVQAYKDKIAKIADSIDKAKGELADIQAEGKEAEAKCNDAQADVNTIENSIDQNNSALSNPDIDPSYAAQLRTENNNLRRERTAVKRKADALWADVQKIKARYDRKNREISDLKKQSVQPVEFTKIFQWLPPTVGTSTTQPATAPAAP